MDKSEIGIKLKRLRKKSDYKQEQLAAMCEISLYDYIDIENGNKHPSADVLSILLKAYNLREDDFNRNDYFDHSVPKRVINYIQIVLSLGFILSYFLPFDYFEVSPDNYVNEGNGFSLFFWSDYGANIGISIVLLVFFLEFILHLLLYTKNKKYTNIYKIVFLAMNFISGIVLYIDFTISWLWLPAMWIIIGLIVVHSCITIYDLIKYPLNHDTKHDLLKMRRVFLFIVMVIYALLYVFLLIDVIGSSYDVSVFGIIFYVLFGIYIVSYIFVNKILFESRLYVSFYLAIAPVLYFTLMLIDLISSNAPLDADIWIIPTSMVIPVLFVNLDYYVDMIRGFLRKGDIKEL